MRAMNAIAVDAAIEAMLNINLVHKPRLLKLLSTSKLNGSKYQKPHAVCSTPALFLFPVTQPFIT